MSRSFTESYVMKLCWKCAARTPCVARTLLELYYAPPSFFHPSFPVGVGYWTAKKDFSRALRVEKKKKKNTQKK